jgi:L-fuconolactonase
MIQRLVDAHVHLLNPDRLRYGWLSEIPALNRPFLPDDLSSAAGSLPLQKIVFVQADCHTADALDEVRWVSGLAVEEPRIQGIVAFAPLELAEADDYLTEMHAYPLVKGIRRLIQDEPASFPARPEFVRGVQRLASFGLVFDICIRHYHLPAVIEMVEQCPDVKFVLDHFGKPAIKAGEIEPWAADIARLARYPNVMCKLSGLVTEADWERWTHADLQPYIDVALEHFGVDRVMFGSDWPVSTLATTYKGWVEAAASSVAHLSAEDQDRIFYQNAVEFYSLP